MAQITVPIASFAGGLVVISIRYNNVTWAINRVSGINNSDSPVVCTATRPGYPTQEVTIPAHNSYQRSVAALRFQYVEDEGDDVNGNPLGYNISLGDIEISCRWST